MLSVVTCKTSRIIICVGSESGFLYVRRMLLTSSNQSGHLSSIVCNPFLSFVFSWNEGFLLDQCIERSDRTAPRRLTGGRIEKELFRKLSLVLFLSLLM